MCDVNKIENPALELFLKELWELSEKHGMYIDSTHDGYYAPLITDSKTGKIVALELCYYEDAYEAEPSDSTHDAYGM